MHLIRISTTAFKGLPHAIVEFAPGITIVRGPNEAGKSSLQQAVLAALFGDPSSSAASYSTLHAWHAGRKCRVVLTFDVDEVEYQIARDFDIRKSTLANIVTNSMIEGRDGVKKALSEISGLSDEDVYKATACITQQDLARLQAGAQVKEMLQRTVTGGGEESDVAAALKKLTDEDRDVFRKGRRGGTNRGAWVIANDELQAASDRYAQIAEQVAQTVEARNFVAAHGDELETMSAQLKDDEALLDRVTDRRSKDEKLATLQEQCTALNTRIDDIERLQAEIGKYSEQIAEMPETTDETVDSIKAAEQSISGATQRVEAATAEVSRLEAEVDEAQAAASLRAAEHSIPEAAQRVEAATAEISHTEVGIEETQAERENAAAASKAPFATIGLIAAGIVTPLAIWQGIIGNWPGWIVLLFAIAGGAVCFQKIRHARGARNAAANADERISQLSSQLELLREQLSTRETELASARETSARDSARIGQLQSQLDLLRKQLVTRETELASARETFADMLQHSGFPSVAEYVTSHTQRKARVADKQAAEIRLSAILREDNLDELRARLGELNLERIGLRDLLDTPEMLAAVMEPAQIMAHERKVKRVREVITSLDSDLRRHRDTLEHSRYDVEDELRAEAALAAAQKRVVRLAQYEKVLALTTSAIQQARQETVRTAADLLAPQIEEYVEVLTEGRYSQARLGDDLEPSVYSEEKQDYATPNGELSLATREQIYLACRLAISALLWQDGAPPILLDDPLVNFDVSRKAAAMRLLREMSRDRQIVLFTCSDEYDEYADSVVVLNSIDA